MFDRARQIVLRDRAKARKALTDEIKRLEKEELKAELDQIESDELTKSMAGYLVYDGSSRPCSKPMLLNVTQGDQPCLSAFPECPVWAACGHSKRSPERQFRPHRGHPLRKLRTAASGANYGAREPA